MRKALLVVWGYGLLSWLIPFLVSSGFVDRSGQILIPQPLFKSLMVVISGGIGALLLVLAFRVVRPTLRSGLELGLCWLALNLALDAIVLIPLTGLSAVNYAYDIGLRYLLIPIMAAAIGATAGREAGRKSTPTGLSS